MCSSTHRLTRSSFTFSMFLALAISSALADGSRGTPTDPEVDRIHSEAIRVYYHDPDTVTTYSEWVRDETGAFYWATVHGDRFTSVKENALLDDQTLYYDYYPPLTSHPKVNKVCAMFFHGGGYTVGYANQGYDTEIRPFREAGFHVISVEYRRGWFGTGKSGPGSGEPDIPREDADRFEVAVEDAFEDVQEACSSAPAAATRRFPSGICSTATAPEGPSSRASR